MVDKYILAADIGATKTDIGLFCALDGNLQRVVVQRFGSCGEVEFLRRVKDFLAAQLSSGILRAVCFGVAGPVVAGRVEATNLGLKLDEKSLRKELSCPQLFLVNDLFATAAAIPTLESRDFAILQIGDDTNINSGSPVAIMAPGTGLGMAFLLGGEKLNILASEGGHADFAPRDEAEVELWRYLKKRFGRVSCERLLSGPGLVNIFDWLKNREAAGGSNRVDISGLSHTELGGAEVVAAAAAGDRVALAAISYFTAILGGVAGDLVLSGMAAGGLCLAGGIPGKIINYLRQGQFINAFNAKGRMSNWIKQVPVKVVLNQETALLGAAWIALDRSANQQKFRDL